MVTQKEFLEIVEKHLELASDGSIVINDPILAKKYGEYLKQVASKVATTRSNAGCVNVFYCP